MVLKVDGTMMGTGVGRVFVIYVGAGVTWTNQRIQTAIARQETDTAETVEDAAHVYASSMCARMDFRIMSYRETPKGKHTCSCPSCVKGSAYSADLQTTQALSVDAP